MGKRRIRFDQRKNYERKLRLHRQQLQLYKSTPQSSLVVKLTIKSYISADVSKSLTCLYNRLQNSQMLPQKWKMATIVRDNGICGISLSV